MVKCRMLMVIGLIRQESEKRRSEIQISRQSKAYSAEISEAGFSLLRPIHATGIARASINRKASVDFSRKITGRSVLVRFAPGFAANRSAGSTKRSGKRHTRRRPRRRLLST